MSLAWASVAILILLLPGVSFFIGLATFERLPREIIRSSVISEIAMAVLIAIAIHTVSIVLLNVGGFRLSHFFSPFVDYSASQFQKALDGALEWALPFVIYIFVTSAIGFVFGSIIAWGVLTGSLRFLAIHRWLYDIIRANRGDRFVTAFVMTTTVENNRVLMYRGRVHEFFLKSDGTLAYIVLRNCARYHMIFEGDKLATGAPVELLSPKQAARSPNLWDRLFIEGSNIANVLFDPSPEVTIKQTPESSAALNAEVAKRRAEIRARLLAAARARLERELRNRSPQSS